MENFQKSITGILFLFSIIIFVYSFTLQSQESAVHFFDVGQGDSIFIEAKNGNQILIDGGKDSSVISQLSSVMKYGDKEIDAIIITHYDFDHIGGLDKVLNLYKVKNIFVNGAELSNQSSKNLFALIKEKNIPVYKISRDSQIDMGSGMSLKTLYPFRNKMVKTGNAGSVVLMLTEEDVFNENTKSKKYLLTGDADSKIENELVYLDGKNLKADVLKLGHHGSKTSSSELFLKTVNPEAAIISAGLNNQYGHPHIDVINRLKKLSIPTIATFDGMISF